MKDVQERRRKFIEVYLETLSPKKAISVVSKEFGVNEATLRVDWSRRHKWPKEIFEGVNDPVFTFYYLLEIRGALRQLENLIRKAKNPNCKLGAIRTKVDTLFKLMNLQRVASLDKVLDRMEKLKAMFEASQSAKECNSGEVES